MIGPRIAALGGSKVAGRVLKLTNATPVVQTVNTGSFDIFYTTLTGNILLRLVCGDVSATVESPYGVTFDTSGANLPFVQRQVITGATSGSAEGTGRPRLIIATLKGAPVTGVAKIIRVTTFASTLSNFTVLVNDLPTWWSGAVGNGSVLPSITPAKNSHTITAIATSGANSLVVGCGGQLDGTLGALGVAGQGAPWKQDTGMLSAAVAATAWQAMYVSKLVPKSGVSCDLAVSLLAGSTSSTWGGGMQEIRP